MTCDERHVDELLLEVERAITEHCRGNPPREVLAALTSVRATLMFMVVDKARDDYREGCSDTYDTIVNEPQQEFEESLREQESEPVDTGDHRDRGEPYHGGEDERPGADHRPGLQRTEPPGGELDPSQVGLRRQLA